MRGSLLALAGLAVGGGRVLADSGSYLGLQRLRCVGMRDLVQGVGITNDGTLVEVARDRSGVLRTGVTLADGVAGYGPAFVAAYDGAKGSDVVILRTVVTRVAEETFSMELDSGTRSRLELEAFDFDAYPSSGSITVEEYRVGAELVRWEPERGVSTLSATNPFVNEALPVALTKSSPIAAESVLMISPIDVAPELPGRYLGLAPDGSPLDSPAFVMGLPGHELQDLSFAELEQGRLHLWISSDLDGGEGKTNTTGWTWRLGSEPACVGRDGPPRPGHDALPLSGLPGYRAIELSPGTIAVVEDV